VNAAYLITKDMIRRLTHLWCTIKSETLKNWSAKEFSRSYWSLDIFDNHWPRGILHMDKTVELKFEVLWLEAPEA